jgi:tRNA pseudouridine38-40 synthase
MRIALKLAYLGQGYHGFQRQPDQITVEQVVLKALDELELLKGSFCFAGRTDRGVNAVGQVITFDIEEQKRKLAVPRVINSKLPGDVWFWASAVVPDDIHARSSAIWRKYRYLMYHDSLDIGLMQRAAQFLVGTHDFRNFSAEKRCVTLRSIMCLDIEEKGDMIIFDIKGNAFLWKMVRKIVRALEMIGSGEKEITWIRDLLDPTLNQGVAAAPAEGLIFMDVGYPMVEWKEDSYAKNRAAFALGRLINHQRTLAEVTRELHLAMEFALEKNIRE